MDIRALFDLTGKTAIVTGASKGIGKAIALGLAQAGAQVVVSSRNQEAVDEVATELRTAGHRAQGIACHVGDKDQLASLVQQTNGHFGPVDILVNNAATNPFFGPIEELDMGAFQKTMNINLEAAILLSNLVYPQMKASGEGSIIHISSIEGIHASALFSAYNVSKAALIMLTKNQAAEWGKDKVRVNVICPGFVKTKLSKMLWSNENVHNRLIEKIPLGRMAEPEEMAGLAVFLASKASSYMTGSTLVQDGGLLNGPIL
ncbi:MAG: SDR family oxidoreductase [Cyclobacteriaceae bacterium]|nr:SDR family oxidoreductase [Cyclobacteriaceae bacterium]